MRSVRCTSTHRAWSSRVAGSSSVIRSPARCGGCAPTWRPRPNRSRRCGNLPTRFAATALAPNWPRYFADEATVATIGDPDVIGDGLIRRGDIRVLALDAGFTATSFLRRMERYDVDAEPVDAGVAGAAVGAADVVLVEALAIDSRRAVMPIGSSTIAGWLPPRHRGVGRGGYWSTSAVGVPRRDGRQGRCVACRHRSVGPRRRGASHVDVHPRRRPERQGPDGPAGDRRRVPDGPRTAPPQPHLTPPRPPTSSSVRVAVRMARLIRCCHMNELTHVLIRSRCSSDGPAHPSCDTNEVGQQRRARQAASGEPLGPPRGRRRARSVRPTIVERFVTSSHVYSKTRRPRSCSSLRR